MRLRGNYWGKPAIVLLIGLLMPLAGSCAEEGSATSATMLASPSPVAVTATAVPSSSPTSQPTAVPATAVISTSTPTPSGAGQAATATAFPASTVVVQETPTAASRFPVAAVFEKAIRDYSGGLMDFETHNYVGAPLEAAHETKIAEQAFGVYGTGSCSSSDSLFLWREDTRQIYFLVEGNFGLHADACRDFWQVFDDTWRQGDPNNEDLTAAAGQAVPRSGFGKVWRENFYGKSLGGLGFAKAPEQYSMATVQRFEQATALYITDTKAIYVLFDSFRYYTRSGEATGRVWFRVT